MNTELFVLAMTVLLGFIHLFANTAWQTSIRGAKWNMGPRDVTTPPLEGKAGRSDRAFENFKQTFSFFLAAVFLVVATAKTGHYSQLGVWLYLGARLIYIPLYIFNVMIARSLAWLIAVAGIFAVMMQLFI